jgi:hypothetical protein
MHEQNDGIEVRHPIPELYEQGEELGFNAKQRKVRRVMKQQAKEHSLRGDACADEGKGAAS